MPYSYAPNTMGLSGAADTDTAEAILTLERAAESSSRPTLASRRAASDHDLVRSVSNPTTKRAASTPTPILVQPPTPTRPDEPATPPMTHFSPRHSPRHARNASPSGSSLGITITGNVLPEVRSSPRRVPDTLPNIGRRSRRPRLFGFTVMDDASAASSMNNSPENPSSPVENSSPAMLPRRNPVRTRSDTSLNTLPHATPRMNHPPPRPRRDTGLKLDLGGIVPAFPDGPKSAGVVGSPYHGVVKKKSGEVVKSALKQMGPMCPNGTPVDKDARMYGSKSCPTTPSCPKYVHFDAQLERVKLFLHDQKPLVVSRQGSPTLEASEGEGEVEDEVEKQLQIKLPNFPETHEPDAELYLESLMLNDERDALRGVIMCKNMAFQKWVAVRFTFDWWQTTSEVTATHKESVRDGQYDRFAFNLKLQDLLERIEEKTLFLCIRYATGGRDIWDSNGGSNYQVLFEKKAPEQPRYMPKRSQTMPQGQGRSVSANGSPWSVTGSSGNDRMADLRAKLNRLTEEDRELTKPISPRRAKFASPRASPRMSPRKGPDGADLPTFSSRYDFGSALKSSRKLSPTIRGGDLPEVHQPSREFYSPRGMRFNLPGPDSPNSPLPGVSSPLAGPSSPLPFGSHSPLPGPRSPLVGGLGPTSPVGPPSPVSPVPVVGNTLPLVSAPPALASGSNSSSTSLSSVSSLTATPADSPSLALFEVSAYDTADSATSESPASPPSDSPLSPAEMLPPWGKERSQDDMSLASYSNFIQQFCWGGVSSPDSGPQVVRRVQSTSSMGDYFTPPHAEPHDGLTPRSFTPTTALSRTHSGTTVIASSTGITTVTSASGTPSHMRSVMRTTPPSREDLEHVDNAIRSLSSSLSNTPTSATSPNISPSLSPSMSRIHSGMGASVLAA